MINSKPNNKNYHQGNYIPKNRDKVIKFNNEGGIYYRSSLEYRMMIFLDNSDKVKKWGAECISIPYQLTHYESNGDINLKSHTYYSDFYYELESNNEIRRIIVEVKPESDYKDVLLLQEKKFEVPDNPTIKRLKNLEYRLKMAQKNLKKWETMIKFCDKKGWEFIVITDSTLKKLGV
jgi:hypothetical protein